eukprot:TRINITY_DN1368_c0_g1::TRINITY_DN1368_c0_g1_i1::g.19955::m.19955 TRINITY_DN1368_c0_g1::TRINITY_DN1368_c0_g1_i1::g.19955  ORF type:complete len:367 (+),score=80.68,sp/Q9U9R7/SNAG_DICDI/30.58/5e-36,SNAP/PF14938.1/3e-18,TPR_12/PF13424.1/0.021,TPR_12/PF13424.1/0.41,TPR_12/PF13424.1/1.3,TPR_11/PF13414.1/0.068,TPR_11/PF13414.1/0.052,TPR_11/PF13414.1/1.6e+02,TPR_14/PF13428.1/1.5e+03,TPR_14/PF13428.1/56,TPR_14/PF13428.1/4.7e+02,TPR_14/PF13428.1/9.5,TPR_14/PF13428.1/14,TPR_14/PF13428.1/20,PPR_3/PF13812.1/
MSSKHIEQGDDHMKAGKNHAKVNILKWSADWDAACREFEKAAVCYKNAKEFDKCVNAYKKAAEAYEKAGNKYATATSFEKAGNILRDRSIASSTPEDQKDAAAKEGAELYKSSSQWYDLNGSPDKAAEMLVKAAKLLEPTDPDSSMVLLEAACLIFERDDRQQFAQETYRTAVTLAVKTNNWDKAVDLLSRQREAHRKLNSEGHVHAAQLGMILLRLRQGDFAQADQLYHEFAAESAGWTLSGESRAADALLQAFESGKADQVTEALKIQTFNFLDPTLTRVAKALKLDHCPYIPPRQNADTTMSLEDFTAPPPPPLVPEGGEEFGADGTTPQPAPVDDADNLL